MRQPREIDLKLVEKNVKGTFFKVILKFRLKLELILGLCAFEIPKYSNKNGKKVNK